MSTIQSTTIRPGLLVSLKTSVTGNVTYSKRTIEAAKLTDEGVQKAKWETERTITDPVELAEATVVRGKVRRLIGSICANSAFGLLCPESKAEDLAKLIAEARQIADDFNDKARLNRVSVYIITGRIAADDVEAAKALRSEIRELLDDMADGVKRMDVKAIREAAAKARSVGMMLSPQAEAMVRVAMDAARATAKKIVQAGDTAAQEIDVATVRKLAEARTSFLDLDDTTEVAAPAKPASRGLDLTPAAPIKPKSKAKARAAEVD